MDSSRPPTTFPWRQMTPRKTAEMLAEMLASLNKKLGPWLIQVIPLTSNPNLNPGLTPNLSAHLGQRGWPILGGKHFREKVPSRSPKDLDVCGGLYRWSPELLRRSLNAVTSGWSRSSLEGMSCTLISQLSSGRGEKPSAHTAV